MKIGFKDEWQFDIEYTAEEIKGVEFDWPPRFRSSKYYDLNTNTLSPGAPEDLKKEYASFAWAMLELDRKGIQI